MESPSSLQTQVESVFFAGHDEIMIHEHYFSLKPKSEFNLETLGLQLFRKKPLIASGNFGPENYEDPPSKLFDKKFHNVGKSLKYSIWGWKKNSSRKEKETNTFVMVLGGEKKGGREYIYYRRTKPSTSNATGQEKTFYISQTDEKVYLTTLETFRIHLAKIFFPIWKKNETITPYHFPDSLNSKETEWAEMVASRCHFPHETELRLIFSLILGKSIFSYEFATAIDQCRKLIFSLPFLIPDGKEKQKTVESIFQEVFK